MTIKMMILSLISSSHEVCPIAYSEELTYWGISELFVEPCCQELYYGRYVTDTITVYTIFMREVNIIFTTVTPQKRHDEEGEPKRRGQHLRLSKHMCWSHKTMVFLSPMPMSPIPPICHQKKSFHRWWYLFEYPSLSKRARICALISFFFVLVMFSLSLSLSLYFSSPSSSSW